MIDVILVEDDGEKRRVLAEAIYEAGVPESALRIAGSVFEAKQALAAKACNLLVLDINIPKRPDKPPQSDGGLEVLRWLKSAGSGYRPPYIVGTTAFEDAHRAAVIEFDNLLWHLVRFSHTDLSWRTKLISSIRQIADMLTPPHASDGVTHHIDFGIVAALESPELNAVQNISQTWTECSVKHDSSRYFTGEFSTKGHKASFAAVAASDKGLPGAAAATMKLVYTFRPKVVAIVGICAGVKGRTNIGDVIVADPSWDWGSGKFKWDKITKREEFHPAAYQMRLDEKLKNVALDLRSDASWLKDAHTAFEGTKPPEPPTLRVGPIASGGSVLQSSAAVRRVLEQHKDLIGIEMEIFSVMFACHTAPAPRPTCIGLKAVCDFGDDDKDDKFQPYAAHTAAVALRRIALEISPKE